MRRGAFLKPFLATIVLAFFLSILASGCSYVKPAPLANAGPPKPFDTLRAEAIIDYKAEKELKNRANITVSAPASFLIEILGPFNSPVTTIVSNGDSLYVFSEKGLNRYGWDEANPVIPYPLTPEELSALLMGAETLDAAKAQANTSYKVERDRDGNISNITKFKDGSELFKVTLSDFKDAGNGVLPFDLTIDDGFRKLHIKYKKIEVNPEVKPEIFDLESSIQKKTEVK